MPLDCQCVGVPSELEEIRAAAACPYTRDGDREQLLRIAERLEKQQEAANAA